MAVSQPLISAPFTLANEAAGAAGGEIVFGWRPFLQCDHLPLSGSSCHVQCR